MSEQGKAPAPAKRKKLRQLEVIVAEAWKETPDSRTLVLFTGNDHLDYKPGHFITIDPRQFPALGRWVDYLEDVKGKKEPPRAYSLSSAPHERYLSITVKEEVYVPGQTKYPPLLSPLLTWRTDPGTRLVVTGFAGPYVLPDDIEARTDQIVHICAGSGAVPNFSILKHALATDMALRHTFICGNKTWDDIMYREELQKLAESHPEKVRVIHALSRESDMERFKLPAVRGRVTADLIRDNVDDPSSAVVFACGPAISRWDKKRAKETGVATKPRFLESVLAALEEVGVPKKNVRRESYG